MQNGEERLSVVLENQGQKIFGVLHRSLNVGKCPAVLICHGLAGHKSGHYRIYVELAKRLTELGIAVFRFDFRGCGDSEGDFTEITVEGEVSDAMTAMQYLASLPFVDPARIGVLGRSFGGVISVLLAAQFKNIKSLALWSPMFDPNEWKAQWKVSKESFTTINGQEVGGHLYPQLFEIDLQSCLEKISHIPMLHIHGEKDTVVQVLHADKFQRQRLNGEAESRFIRLPESDHHFTPLEERKFAVETTANWFLYSL